MHFPFLLPPDQGQNLPCSLLSLMGQEPAKYPLHCNTCLEANTGDITDGMATATESSYQHLVLNGSWEGGDP